MSSWPLSSMTAGAPAVTEPRHPGPGTALSLQALLQAIVEISDDAIVVCDDAGRVASWSPSAERLFGSVQARSLGEPLSGLFAEHIREDVDSVVARMMAGEAIVHFETEVVRTDGMPVPVSMSLCPLGIESGAATGGVIIARDVTEQRLAQAALAEVEARLQEGEALAHIGSWLWDVRTGVVQWSTEFHRIHGIDPLDFGGTLQSYLGAVHPDDREALHAALQGSASSGRPFEQEYRIVLPDEEVRVVRTRAQPTVGSAGAVVGLRGIGHQVSHDVGPDRNVTRDRPDA